MHRRLLYLWVTGVLFLPLCWGNQDEEYDDYVTPTPDYDYSATLDYIFYSNSSQPIDYSLFETIDENEDEQGDSRNEASVIGLSCPVMFLGLVAKQIWRLA